jgi:outer membrane lipopolysaccharide assembly protein LptE/RlpB
MARRAAWCGALAFTVLLAACGYHVAGKGDLLPKDIHTIAITPFFNVTSRYKIEQYLTRSVSHEFLSRTRFKVVSDESQADAVLRGGVMNIYLTPIIFDPASNRASTIQAIAQLQVTLTDRKTGKVLYQNQNFEARQRYEISIDPKAYLEESEVGLQRLSESVARNLVSAILEQF